MKNLKSCLISCNFQLILVQLNEFQCMYYVMNVFFFLYGVSRYKDVLVVHLLHATNPPSQNL